MRKRLKYDLLQGGCLIYHGIPSAGVQCANLDLLSTPSDSPNTFCRYRARGESKRTKIRLAKHDLSLKRKKRSETMH